MAKPPFRVQVVAQENMEYFRDTVLGARRYGFSSGRLTFVDRWLDHELAGDLKKLVKRDGIQGIVAAIHTETDEKRFAALGVPVVNVSNALIRPRVSLVTQDDVAVGRLAAAHLQACGCRAYGFWGQTGSSYSEERLRGFREALKGVSVGEPAVSGRAGSDAGGVVGKGGGDGAGEVGDKRKADALSVNGCVNEVETPAALYGRMRDWLAKQPRPVGIFAVLDTYALSLMRAARELGWRVPEDVSLLGAGNEDFWVEFESVPLSSVRLPARQIGYEAAALLDKLITRGGAKFQAVRLSGAEIVARRSTDVLYVEDDAVAKAVRFIREQATGNPYVADVVKAAGVSRSVLQTRFRAALGRSVLEEIQRVRVDRAQALLAGTELAMSVVAERCGFPNSQRFSVLFRQIAGISPSDYRKQFREG